MICKIPLAAHMKETDNHLNKSGHLDIILIGKARLGALLYVLPPSLSLLHTLLLLFLCVFKP